MTPTNPRNAGRKARPDTKKRGIGVALPPYLIDWMRAQTQSHAVLIEDALCEVHKIKKPEVVKKTVSVDECDDRVAVTQPDGTIVMMHPHGNKKYDQHNGTEVVK